MKTTVLMPARAPAAATALARLPVLGQAKTLASQLAGGAQRAGDDPVLEGVGGVGRVVLDPEVGDAELAAEVVRLEQPGEAGLGVGALLDVGRAPAAAPCSARCWAARPRSPRGSRPGSRRRSPAGRSTPDTRRRGRARPGGRTRGTTARWRARRRPRAVPAWTSSRRRQCSWSPPSHLPRRVPRAGTELAPFPRPAPVCAGARGLAAVAGTSLGRTLSPS